MRRLFFLCFLCLLLGSVSSGGQVPADLSGSTTIPPKMPITPAPLNQAGMSLLPMPEHAILATKRDIAAIDPEKLAEIRKMFQLTHAEVNADAMIKQTFAVLEKRNPQVLPHVWNELKKQLSVPQMIEQMVYIYDRHFTLQEIKGMNAFYDSPTGKKMLAAMPLVMIDSFQIARQMGREAATKVAAEVKAERGTAGVAPDSHK